ncbi:MAG: helix-turn-helix transcriptional regulator [Candidatus Marinimicrobia bacterium]|nr:helix-turn-helix transcriptional regulator [Candidatus Neomarinimicrobiota bacterium]
MTLNELVAVAHFSPFHFHRLFRAFVGETLKQFIQRIRLEKAAERLITNPLESITAIALDSGFSGSATFARAFKEYFCVRKKGTCIIQNGLNSFCRFLGCQSLIVLPLLHYFILFL